MDVVATRTSPAVIPLGSDVLRAELAPSIGASLTRLQFRLGGEWIDILRPAAAQALRLGNVREMACFPMAPYASLIHDSKFVWGGRTYRVKANMPDRPHAVHGDAWQHAWEVQEVDADRVVLRYRQKGGRFPFPYEAVLVASVRADEISLTLSLVNQGSEPMPVGMGFHPFFRRQPDLTLQFDATAKWTRDQHGRMLNRARCSEEDSFSTPRSLTQRVCNDVYDGWHRSAVLHWASTDVRATLTAEGALNRLLLFSPADRDVVCVEPISNLPDGFNLLAAGSRDSGVRSLEPGDSISGTMRIAASLATA